MLRKMSPTLIIISTLDDSTLYIYISQIMFSPWQFKIKVLNALHPCCSQTHRRTETSDCQKSITTIFSSTDTQQNTKP